MPTVEEESRTNALGVVPQKSVPAMEQQQQQQQPVLRFFSSVLSGFVEQFRDIRESRDVGLSWQPYHNAFT